MQQQTLPGRQL